MSEGPAEFPPGVGSSWGEPVSLLKHRSSSDAPDARGEKIHGLPKFFQDGRSSDMLRCGAKSVVGVGP